MNKKSIHALCGQLIVAGFDGLTLPNHFRDAIADQRLAGAIVFSRNVADPEALASLNREIIAAGAGRPLFLGVDQEGGRVRRLRGPFLDVPAMRCFGAEDDLELTSLVAQQVGRELRAMGFNLCFAPVMDVDSNPDNPVIGDRSFGRNVRTVVAHGCSFIRGLQSESVLACAKHFPGHGDTLLDSHLSLPRVDASEARLKAVELPPFRAAAGVGVAAMMTAHVVFSALDPDVPATFSRAICGSLLRREMGFEGVLFCDDLEMGAVTQGRSIEEAAVQALLAGTDVLLICHSADLQRRAHAALVSRAELDERFLARCKEAAQRSMRLRSLAPAKVADDSTRQRVLGSAQREVAARLQAMLERQSQVRTSDAPVGEHKP